MIVIRVGWRGEEQSTEYDHGGVFDAGAPERQPTQQRIGPSLYAAQRCPSVRVVVGESFLKPDKGQDWIRGRPLNARRVLLMAAGPVAGVLVVLAPGIPPKATMLALTVVVLFVPGFYAWSIFAHSPYCREAFAVPSLAFVLSMAINLPAVVVSMLLQWEFSIALAIIVAQMTILGGFAAIRGDFRASWPSGMTRWIVPIAVVVGAVAVSVITFYWTADNQSYMAYIESIRENGRFPFTNPYIAGDLPIPPRWRIAGWVGLLGGISHWSNAGSAFLLERILPPILIVSSVSAMYTLARTVTRRLSLSIATAVAAALLPLLDDPLQNPSLYTPWYRAISQDKYVMALVMLPVAMAMLVSLTESVSVRQTIGAAAFVLAAAFVHPFALPTVALLLAGYLVVRFAQRRVPTVRSLAALFLALLPVALAMMAVIWGFGSSFGVAGVSLSSATEVQVRRYGPAVVLEVSETDVVTSVDPVDSEAVERFFEIEHTVLGEQPRLVFTNSGRFIASPAHLLNPLYVFVVIAAGTLLIYERRSMLTAWLVGTSAVVVSVHVWPLAAQIVSLVVPPWQLWRLTWFAPVAFAAAWIATGWQRYVKRRYVGVVVVAAIVAWSAVAMPHDGFLRSRSSDAMQGRESRSELMERVSDLDGVFLATKAASNMVGIVPKIQVVSARGPSTMSNNFPSDRQSEALMRMRDQRRFFKERTRSKARRKILERWDVDYVIAEPGLLAGDSLPLVAVRSVGQGLVVYRVEASAGGTP